MDRTQIVNLIAEKSGVGSDTVTKVVDTLEEVVKDYFAKSGTDMGKLGGLGSIASLSQLSQVGNIMSMLKK